MKTARRRQAAWAIAASIIAHLAVLVVVVLQRPTLRVPDETAGPPEPIIPILLMPRTPSAAAEAPTPIRLHRRPQRFTPPEIPTAPLVTPAAPAPGPAAPAPRAPPGAFHPSPLPDGPKADVRTALRQGSVGCINPNAVGLTAAERAVCDEKLGKGAKDAPFLGLGLAADKQKTYDQVAAHKEACRQYRAGMPTANVSDPDGRVGMPTGLGSSPALRDGAC